MDEELTVYAVRQHKALGCIVIEPLSLLFA